MARSVRFKAMPFLAFTLTACVGAERASVSPPPHISETGGYHLPAPPLPGAKAYIGLTHGQLIGMLGIPTRDLAEGNERDLFYDTAICRLWVYEIKGIVSSVTASTPNKREPVDIAECINSIPR